MWNEWLVGNAAKTGSVAMKMQSTRDGMATSVPTRKTLVGTVTTPLATLILWKLLPMMGAAPPPVVDAAGQLVVGATEIIAAGLGALIGGLSAWATPPSSKEGVRPQ